MVPIGHLVSCCAHTSSRGASMQGQNKHCNRPPKQGGGGFGALGWVWWSQNFPDLANFWHFGRFGAFFGWGRQNGPPHFKKYNSHKWPPPPSEVCFGFCIPSAVGMQNFRPKRWAQPKCWPKPSLFCSRLATRRCNTIQTNTV